MGVAVFVLNYIFPVSNTRSITQIIHLGLYAVIGAVIYFVLIYLNGSVYTVFGEKTVNNVLKKLHLKR